MKELDFKAWRSFRKIGTRLLPHLGRQITNHSGISAAEYVVLVSLYEMGTQTCSVNRLAEGLGWEISRMSHQITRMAENSLVKKAQCPSDARSFEISITTKGHKIIDSAIPLQSQEINHCFSDVLTNTQLETLIEISEAISMHMKDHHPLNKKEVK
jgi:DNA-binding MarR family transcriptional regulator